MNVFKMFAIFSFLAAQSASAMPLDSDGLATELTQHMWSEEWTTPVDTEVSTEEAYQMDTVTSETAETVAGFHWWNQNTPDAETIAQHMWSEEWTTPVDTEVSTEEAYQMDTVTSETAETVAGFHWWNQNTPDAETIAQHMWSEEWTTPVDTEVSTEVAYQMDTVTSETAETLA